MLNKEPQKDPPRGWFSFFLYFFNLQKYIHFFVLHQTSEIPYMYKQVQN